MKAFVGIDRPTKEEFFHTPQALTSCSDKHRVERPETQLRQSHESFQKVEVARTGPGFLPLLPGGANRTGRSGINVLSQLRGAFRDFSAAL